MKTLFRLFERWTTALPESDASQPPSTLFAFCRHYTKGFEIPLICMSVLTAILAMLEVSLFGFMGQLVDWLANKDPGSLLQDEGAYLLGMTLLVLVAIPILVLLHALIAYQSLLVITPCRFAGLHTAIC